LVVVTPPRSWRHRRTVSLCSACRLAPLQEWWINQASKATNRAARSETAGAACLRMLACRERGSVPA
jgi:hypothetical protein